MVFKYYAVSSAGSQSPSRSIDNLKNDNICFTDIDIFNDPFEGVGEFFYKTSKEEDEYWKAIGINLAEGLCERVREDSHNLLRFKQRIWCVTETYDNPLMWAHYAASHKGFCVGYAKESIQKICTKFAPIKYCASPGQINTDNLDMNEIDDLLFVKSTDWSYEREWRALYTLAGNDVEHLDYCNYFQNCFKEDPKYLYAPHGYALMNNLEVLRSPQFILKKCPPLAVYLGLRMESETRHNIIAICREKCVDVHQMRQRPNSFALTAIQVL
ncbi:hypothetical protein SDC9_69160 [bioreactor metagenome]|uniref:DUF2971 domain-containing protein n=1 Tax=bioreactor metagenome TaxID=1076179 RepID=A0A644Y2D8_9ZZZZ